MIVTLNPICGISLLKLFLTFSVTLLLLSELTVKDATADAAALFMVQVEVIIKTALLLMFWSVMLLLHLTTLPRPI